MRELACVRVRGGGHLHVLRWARANGWPLDGGVVDGGVVMDVFGGGGVMNDGGVMDGGVMDGGGLDLSESGGFVSPSQTTVCGSTPSYEERRVRILT